jgi:hypothetical protein
VFVRGGFIELPLFVISLRIDNNTQNSRKSKGEKLFAICNFVYCNFYIKLISHIEEGCDEENCIMRSFKYSE